MYVINLLCNFFFLPPYNYYIQSQILKMTTKELEQQIYPGEDVICHVEVITVMHDYT